MRKTVYFKFIMGYIIFALFGFLVVSSFVTSMVRRSLLAHESEALYKEAVQIADTFASGLYNNVITLESAKTQIDILQSYLSATIWIINPSGLIILDSSTPLDITAEDVYVEGFGELIDSTEFYEVTTLRGYWDSNHLCVYAPITNGYTVQGYVVISKPMETVDAFQNSLLNISYIMLVILFLLSLIILIFFTEAVYIPLRKITRATEEYASGNLHYEFTVDSDDEMGYLAATLNYMASELAKVEDNEKKLVANVSHDFRSPLTSIKGYSEAMLDGTIPPEMHDKYLTIVQNESERLIKLTNSLLTLNNIGTNRNMLELSDFEINSTIRSIISTFEGACREKKIRINLVLTGEEMYVHADKTKIEQVIYNLLDNAIKFSNKDSEIKIETQEKNTKLLISVKDNGIGIPKESLHKIFDRFYKTDSSRGKDKKGTGLGLSITKEIIRAHNENIDVISTEGEGSEFLFTLPISEVQTEDDV